MSVSRYSARRVAAIGLTLLAAGCTSDDVSSSQASTAGELSSAQIVDLLNGGSASVGETEQVIADCMAERGFVWFLSAEVSTEAGVIGDQEYVSRFGYGIMLTPPETATETDPNLALFDSLSVAEQGAYNLALVGNEQGVAPISADSCLGLEQAILLRSGDLLRSETAQQVLAEFQILLDLDPRVIADRQNWAQCMADAGYAYEARDEIFAEYTAYRALPVGPERSGRAEQEIAVASADFACSSATGAIIEQVTGDITDQLAAKYGMTS